MNDRGVSPSLATRPSRPIALLILLLLPGDGIAPPPARGARSAPGTGEAVAGVDGLTDRQRRGMKIYQDGTSPSGGKITASLGGSVDEMPASFVPCANCHGRDGRGRTEGGIDPPDLTWRTLAHPRADLGRGRRARPSYTPALLGRVVTMGIDPSGERLGVGMPRYQFSNVDQEDLIDYLKVLGAGSNPGVLPTALRIGTILPPPGASGGLRETISETLRSAIADLNERGGIYQRRLELEVDDLGGSPAEVVPRVAAFLKRRQVFALVSPFLADREEDAVRVFKEEGIPVIGPFSSTGPTADPPEREIFFVEPDLTTQALALIAGGWRRSPAEAPAIVRGEAPDQARAADQAATLWAGLAGVEPPRFVIREGAGPADLDRIVAEMRRSKTDVVLYIGPTSLSRALAFAADRASWHPRLYAPGVLWDRRLEGLPAGFDGRIVLAFPRQPDDLTREGSANLARLRARHGLSREHEVTQLAVLTAFKILEEGLRRLGRQPTRAGLIDELSRLDEFETGFSRPVTFGPTRRLGSDGAYLLILDIPAGRVRPAGWSAARGQ